MRLLLFGVIVRILMNNVYEAEAINWEVGSQYILLAYAQSGTLFGEILRAQSQARAQLYFGFTLSDTVIVLPSFDLARFGGQLAGTVSFKPQYHPFGYTKSGVFVSSFVSAAFSSSDSTTVGAVGVGLGYQWRLKSNSVFRISTSAGVISSQSENGDSASLYHDDADTFLGQIYTSLGYTFNMSD